MIAAVEPIRVMVVDDSTVIRGLLARIIESQPDLRVVASVANGRTAVEMLRLRPVDVVLLDIEMPEMDGLTALPLLLAERPGLRVIMASSLTHKGAQVTMRALALGASDYIPKPSAMTGVGGLATISDELVRKIRALGRTQERPKDAPALRVTERPSAPPRAEAPGGAPEAPQVLAIAASTGGPNALAQLLSGLPRDFPLPTIIVQHMPPFFTAALAERLQRETGRPCREAVHGEVIEGGRTYIAPGDHHMTVMTDEGRPVLRLDQGPHVNYCRPAADPMLCSVAHVYGRGALAVVLTGMGEDGLGGCREIFRHGGRIVVQDQASSTVWGMPGAVWRAGLAGAALPLSELADRVLQMAAASGSPV
ncbi:MAG TPA: chemotaxis response regulator protein-glutamate methylesterase [Longimicrobiaceae bacterium]|nr:chemotaxis response regulator protein-glutamate methylesterase [Longimicrobiaceae bacterium]